MVTSRKMPKADLDSDLLIDELADLGITAKIIPWDSDINWSGVSLVLLRTTWDYFYRHLEFSKWVKKVSGLTKLVNPSKLVLWNMHKSYLLYLEKKGVAIVPTILITKNQARDSAVIFNSLKFTEIVIKPAISGGGVGVLMGKKSDPKLFDHLNELLKTHDVLIQPFVSDIIGNGEVSLIYFDGEFSHAIHKKSADGEYRVQEEYGGSVHLYNPDFRELKIAENILSKIAVLPTYARIDLVNYKNNPVLMELEIIEPELFLKNSAEGLKKFAQVLRNLL